MSMTGGLKVGANAFAIASACKNLICGKRPTRLMKNSHGTRYTGI